MTYETGFAEVRVRFASLDKHLIKEAFRNLIADPLEHYRRENTDVSKLFLQYRASRTTCLCVLSINLIMKQSTNASYLMHDLKYLFIYGSGKNLYLNSRYMRVSATLHYNVMKSP